jgi:cytoskeleton protein RodZ
VNDVEGTGQPATPIQPGATGADEARELGAMLREMRLAHKRELDEIADELRIRPNYLRAIEEGRYGDLPGSTYALGFVRAYADYLGFDVNEAARRFKTATGTTIAATNLVLPSPVAEGRLPTGAVLFVAAILAVLVYGGWYVLSTEGHDPDAVVSAIPSRVAQAVREAMPERSTAPESPRVALTLKPEGTRAGAPAPPSAAPAARPEAATGETAEVDSDAQDVDEEEDSAPPEPEQLASAAAASTRIVLVARADSWVEVRDAAGAPVFSRVMRKDDRYEVPDLPGLLMMTGNAGGIDVMVDGRAAPALGTSGSVKRNIVMDPDRLLAGTAVPPPPPPPTTSPTAIQATTPTSASPAPVPQ